MNCPHAALLTRLQAYTDRFINVLFESLATRVVTLEHDYTALLVSIDRLHHPLLRDLPIGAPGQDGDYHLTRHEFAEKRLAFIERENPEMTVLSTFADDSARPGMVKNLADNLTAEAEGDHSLTAHNNIHITSLIGFLAATRDILEVRTFHSSCSPFYSPFP